MMNAIKKYGAIILAFIMTAAVCLLFATRKQGMFIDEIYTYGLANSWRSPYLSDLKGGTLSDQIFTWEDIQEYLTVGEDDRFAAGSVYYNQTRDVHPPLYYWGINFVSSLFEGSCSKWIGLSFNIVFYLLTLFVLCKTVLLLPGSLDNAAATAALYGVSVLGLSTVMMIRMYTLLTFFTVLFAYTVLKILRAPEKKQLYFLLTAVIFCGMMTQYYFVFYAFFTCLAFDIYALIRKEYKVFFRFSLCAVLGVALMFAAFPASFRHLFVGNGQVVGGSSVTEALKDTALYAEHIRKFREANEKLKAVKYVCIAALACLAAFSWKLPAAVREKKIPFDALVILLPAPVTFLTVAVISPVQEHRYIYNIAPIFVLGISFLLGVLENSIGRFKGEFFVKKAVVLAVAVTALWFAKCMPPTSLFTEQADYDSIIAPYTDCPCVYVSDEFFAPLTQDLLQLAKFRDFLVVRDCASPALAEYLGDAESVVLYIDTSKNWSSGFDAEETTARFGESTGMADCELLYTYDYEGSGGLSSAYLMKNP